MFVSLTRNQRIKAGWIVALAYLLCILAPTLSYALPGEHAVAHCMPPEGVMSGSAHVHDKAVQPIHAHLDAQTHDHSPAPPKATSGDHGQSSIATPQADDEGSSSKGPHTANGQCCALMCVSAMPASHFDIAMPPMSNALRIATSYRALADNGPAVRDRPPSPDLIA
ncbi:hypothetical protein HUU61_13880 [Rhodopseudomonas palustris]|nr:hypothetical protein [Rhodopseudomonas palustris]